MSRKRKMRQKTEYYVSVLKGLESNYCYYKLQFKNISVKKFLQNVRAFNEDVDRKLSKTLKRKQSNKKTDGMTIENKKKR